ncbi:MAG: hypothetical protein RL145_770 [Pseudomonadota bacterium]
MCGIAGAATLNSEPIPLLSRRLERMGELIAHRGPDGAGQWREPSDKVGLAHRRLSIIDLSNAASQPMIGDGDIVICFNGEIYNFIELRAELLASYPFKTQSDTETILAAYNRWGIDCVSHLRGMFAFVIWDAKLQRLFCARDQGGIKPFYYAIHDNVFYFASEAKALLPFLPSVEVDPEGLSEYFAFQFSVTDKTLFKGISQLRAGHLAIVSNGNVSVRQYWDMKFEPDFDRTASSFHEEIEATISDSVRLHLRADVPVGAYVSGGVDSSLIAGLAQQHEMSGGLAFHGKFLEYPGYDESPYARAAGRHYGLDVREVALTYKDFESTIEDVIYHLDFPTAGPGSFPQYHVSKLAAQSVKVVLGGQGGDEIFGGYSRYLVGYFEEAFKAEVEGRGGSLRPSLQDIAPNLNQLASYKPMLKKQMASGLFDPLSERYFRIVNRTGEAGKAVYSSAWDMDYVQQVYRDAFVERQGNVDLHPMDAMTRFDFKFLLPALLQVEDRMSMAHGIESRLPFVDVPVIELAAKIPGHIKYPGGELKAMLRGSFLNGLPPEILARTDKQGFPTPFPEWMSGELAAWVNDVFSTQAARSRPYYDAKQILNDIGAEQSFARRLWGLLCLELWQRRFIDRVWRFEG